MSEQRVSLAGLQTAMTALCVLGIVGGLVSTAWQLYAGIYIAAAYSVIATVLFVVPLFAFSEVMAAIDQLTEGQQKIAKEVDAIKAAQVVSARFAQK